MNDWCNIFVFHKQEIKQELYFSFPIKKLFEKLVKKNEERKNEEGRDHSITHHVATLVIVVAFQGDFSTVLWRCFFLLFLPPTRVRCVCVRACGVYTADSLHETRRIGRRERRQGGGEREQRRGGKNVRVLEEEDCTRGLRPVPAVERVCTGVRDDTLYIEAPLTAHPP